MFYGLYNWAGNMCSPVGFASGSTSLRFGGISRSQPSIFLDEYLYSVNRKVFKGVLLVKIVVTLTYIQTNKQTDRQTCGLGYSELILCNVIYPKQETTGNDFFFVQFARARARTHTHTHTEREREACMIRNFSVVAEFALV